MRCFIDPTTSLAATRHQPRTSTLDDVYVHESGRPGLPAVVFIHGGGPSGQMWGTHLDRLAGRFHCLAPDLPGFGRSNHLAPLSLSKTADLVAELIERHVPSRRAHVVGLSYGGSVVFAILQRHADHVDRAVIDGAAVLPLWGGWGDRLVQLGVTAISPIVTTRLMPALLAPVGLRQLGIALRSASPRAFRRSFREGFTAPSSRTQLEVTCPTLLVAGEKEATVRASNAGLAALMPHAAARFVPGLGHAWFAWRRDLHVSVVEAWLTGEALPEDLETEPPSPTAVARVRRQFDDRPAVPRTRDADAPLGRRHGCRSRAMMPRRAVKTPMRIRDVDLNVKVVGHGYPLVLMHGGPGADLYTLLSFRQCKDQFTLVFYDHRGNGRSTGVPVDSMTWENLTADADALREALGFEEWAVLGHSFGGQVALEYALRYPNSLSHLVLLDTGGEARWSMENASKVLAARGYDPEIVDLAHRWLNGEVPPEASFRALMKLGKAYNPHSGIGFLARELLHGAWRTKFRPEALIYATHHLEPHWTVMDRLGEIHVPTLVMAGEDDFIFPPEHQAQLAAGIPRARLKLIEHAGHNPHDEQTAKVMDELRAFIGADARTRTT